MFFCGCKVKYFWFVRKIRARLKPHRLGCKFTFGDGHLFWQKYSSARILLFEWEAMLAQAACEHTLVLLQAQNVRFQIATGWHTTSGCSCLRAHV